ncbi:hypothetical protein [uncultured Kordia sp.]|uniref:hypothetical protein n=1 Tax=uncultured Kordia sp. TaxID=507699 RepID=UPI00260ED16B|nr:hypothetical protein [uncultured Kordia sp.]
MATINFVEMNFGETSEHQKLIKNAKESFESSLNENSKLRHFNAKIVLSNRNEHDPTKFHFVSCDPKSEEMSVLKFLQSSFLEYLGG